MTAAALELLPACPVCSATALAEYCRVPSLFDAGETIRYDRCGGCGVVFRNPRLQAAARTDAYRDRVMRPEQKALVPRAQTHYRFLARRLRALLPGSSPRRTLDFGCGSGGFLVAARDAGLEPFGLELNRDLANHVRATYGIPVHGGEIADPALGDRRFDVIASFQVFEHLIDPRGVLEELLHRLAPDGVMLIEVPNLNDVRERWRRGATMDDSHLFYFDRASLPHLLRSCGLDVVEIHEGMRPSRFLGAAAARLPIGVYRLLERAMAAIGLTTVLCVIARRGATASGTR